MRFLGVPLILTALVVAAPAAGQGIKVVSSTPLFDVGMQVTDANGGNVGTVIGMSNDGLIVKTDKHEVKLPRTAFEPKLGQLVLIGMTQAQLDAQFEQTAAAATTAIAPGAVVKSVDGIQLGKVDSIADGKVVVALDSGSKLAVPQEGARGNPDGTVLIGYTSAQISALGNQPAAQ